jgi:hypothetical protein
MYQWGLTDTLSAICTILYANLRFLTISCGIVRCWASTLRGRNNAGSTQLWLSPRIQSCDQYSRILLVSGIISKKSQQRTASFLVWCRFAVARGRFWRILLQKSAVTDDAVRPFHLGRRGLVPRSRRSLRNFYATQYREPEWVVVERPAMRAAAGSGQWRPERTHPGRLVDRVVEAGRASGCA